MKLIRLLESQQDLKSAINELLTEFGKPTLEGGGQTLEQAFEPLYNCQISDARLDRALVGHQVINADGELDTILAVIDDEQGTGVELESGLLSRFAAVTIPTDPA